MAKVNYRKIIEKNILPQKLYSSGAMMIMNLMDMPGPYIVELYKEVSNSAPKYCECDFSECHIVDYRNHDSILIMRIQMPTAKVIGDCRYVYLCYNSAGGSNCYFCSALTKNGYRLYGYDKTGKIIRFNYIEKPEDELAGVEEEYWEMIANERMG